MVLPSFAYEDATVLRCHEKLMCSKIIRENLSHHKDISRELLNGLIDKQVCFRF